MQTSLSSTSLSVVAEDAKAESSSISVTACNCLWPKCINLVTDSPNCSGSSPQMKKQIVNGLPFSFGVEPQKEHRSNS